MFFGDDGDISEAALKEMDEITLQKHEIRGKCQEGDVVLSDNYKCMHGRNVFDGTRKHGVAWFEGWEGEDEMKVVSNVQSSIPFLCRYAVKRKKLRAQGLGLALRDEILPVEIRL
jgi:hypothetical protein